MPEGGEYVEVEVLGVGRDPTDKPLVVLKDSDDRELRIYIGQCEAIAIAQRLDAGFEPLRPLTQDLMLGVWKRLGATPVRLSIDDLWETTYYSKITVERAGEAIEIDCRPSDGIALALSAKVPIYVADQVMRKALDPEGEDDDEEL